MAEVLVLGGGFGGLVAAERLAKRLAPEHRVTLVSRGERFLFYPAFVKLAFGRCEPGDVSFDMRETLTDRRVRFVQAEVAAANLAAEIEGAEPSAVYDHEIKLVIDEGGDSSIYFRKGPGDDHGVTVRQGRFWGWAKWVQEKYWESLHG
jgi:NADH dehydrogenase FAD-containing subunit